MPNITNVPSDEEQDFLTTISSPKLDVHNRTLSGDLACKLSENNATINFSSMKQIAAGGQGDIYTVDVVEKIRTPGFFTKYVLKQIRTKASIPKTEFKTHCDITELDRTSLEHNIIKLIQIVSSSDGERYALLPFAPLFLNQILDDLHVLSHNDSLMYYAIVLKIMMDVCKAIKRMHYLGYVHRDIKPENICYYKGSFCIIDLDAAEKIHSDIYPNSVVGTELYRHPRCIKKNEFCNNPKNDIFALGLTMQLLLNQQLRKEIISNWVKYALKLKIDYDQLDDSISVNNATPEFISSVVEQNDIYIQLITIAERMSSLTVDNQPVLEDIQFCLTKVYDKVIERKENLGDNIEQLIIQMARKQKLKASNSEQMSEPFLTLNSTSP